MYIVSQRAYHIIPFTNSKSTKILDCYVRSFYKNCAERRCVCETKNDPDNGQIERFEKFKRTITRSQVKYVGTQEKVLSQEILMLNIKAIVLKKSYKQG